MSLGFLRSLFTPRTVDGPVADWPALDTKTPVVNLAAWQIGPLKFGDPLAKARIFGRPDTCLSTNSAYLELVYGRAGFRLDFDKDMLVYAAFFIAPDEFDPLVGGFRHCVARESSGVSFSAQTTRADLIQVYGNPASTDDLDADDVVVNISRHELTLEFELNKAGHLKRWNVFPEKEFNP